MTDVTKQSFLPEINLSSYLYQPGTECFAHLKHLGDQKIKTKQKHFLSSVGPGRPETGKSDEQERAVRATSSSSERRVSAEGVSGGNKA